MPGTVPDGQVLTTIAERRLQKHMTHGTTCKCERCREKYYHPVKNEQHRRESEERKKAQQERGSKKFDNGSNVHNGGSLKGGNG